MPRKKLSNHDYIKRSKTLRKFGFKLSFRGNRKSSPSQLAAVTKAWNNVRYYTVHAKRNRSEFVRFKNQADRKSWEAYVSKSRIMPGGVFLQRPEEMEKGKWKVKRQSDGTLLETSKKLKAVIIPLDARKLAKNPQKHLGEKMKGKQRPRDYLLTVNGWTKKFSDARRFKSLDEFNRYWENTLLPNLKAAGFNFKKYGKETFALRLVYTPKGKKKGKGEGKLVENQLELFSPNRKLYGRKTFTNRQEWQLKRKGK